ncbi:MAG: 16S rRNA (uracil(1498)-N(3))-methyltransferase [Alistipes sp.]|jgi:16S rRNA (uracil1498-N3)-methyltransferase|nr:16S rRNA (uracil(1498)-N(3))-methyltransferase [Alistipes sp.]
MQLFYAPEISLPRYTLPEEESKHCVRVLRMTVGDELHLTDGKGNMYRCKVVSDNVKRCEVEVVETWPEYERMSYGLTMCVAPTKNIDRFEWFLEKATEIGISEVYPLECDHSERRQIKLEREEKVITAAVKQSLKAYHPVLHDLTSVRDIIAMDFEGEKYIAHCDSSFGERPYLGNLVKKGANTLILIGPEGDFSKEEINFALQNGFKAISLGRERLRTETAAVVATTVVATINKL